MIHRTTTLLLGTALGLGLAASVAAAPVTVVQSLPQGSQLVTVDSAAPGTPLATTAITGLGVGERLIGLDSNPGAGRALYGISNTGQAYVVNGFTGVATPLGAPLALTNGTASTVFRFNPTNGAIRVSTDAEQNLRLNAANGAVIAVDMPTAYAAGDPGAGTNPNITGGAYTNRAGGTSTTLYVIETNRGVLATQGSVGGAPNGPGSGQLQTVGSLGVGAGANSTLDISRTGETVGLINDPLVRQSALYRIDLTTGTATLIAPLAGGNYTALAFTATPLSQVGLTANQRGVGAALDNFTGAPSADLLGLFGGFDGLSAADQAGALQQLSPAAYSLLPELIFQSEESQSTTIRRYLRDVRQGGTDDSAQADATAGRAQIGSNRKLGMWITGNARYGFYRAAVDRYRTSYGATGVTGGLDYRLRPNILVGLTGGYDAARVHLTPLSPESSLDTWYAGAYGTAGYGPFYIEGHGSYGRTDFRLQRVAAFGNYDAFTQAHPKSENATGVGTVGASFRYNGIEVEPFAGGRYTYVNIEGFSEGTSLAALTLPRIKRESVEGLAGLRMGANLTIGGATVRPSIRGEYRHEFEDRHPRTFVSDFAGAGIGSQFAFTTTPLSADYADVGAGVTISGHSPFSVVISYDGQLGKDRSINGITGGFHLAF